MKPTLVRTAVSGGALALTLGVAGPALACVTSDAPGAKPAAFTFASDPGTHSKDEAMTLAELQAKVDGWLAKKIDRLTQARERVSASAKLSDQQKADALTWIDARIAKLGTARDAVAAATTKAEVRAALKAAFTPTVDEVKAAIDAKITRLLAWIDEKQAALEAMTSIDPERKADKLAKLQAWEDKLLALQATIADDTTLEEIKADLEAAGAGHLLSGHRHGWFWGTFGDRGHKHGQHHDRGWGRSDKADPGHWDSRHASTRQVSFSWGRDGSSHRGSDRGGHDRWGSHDGDRDRGGDHRSFGGHGHR